MKFNPLPFENCTIPVDRTSGKEGNTWSAGTIVTNSVSYSELWVGPTFDVLKPITMRRVEGVHYFLFNVEIGDTVSTYTMRDSVIQKYTHSVVSIDTRGVTLKLKTNVHKKTMKFLRYSINKNRLPFIIPAKSVMRYRYLHDNNPSNEFENAYPHLERKIYSNAVKVLIGCGSKAMENDRSRRTWHRLWEELCLGNVYELTSFSNVLLKRTGQGSQRVTKSRVLSQVNKAMHSLQGRVIDTTFDSCIATMQSFEYDCDTDDIENLLL